MQSTARLCLYDADCGVCGYLVRLGQRWDRHCRIEFIPSTDASRWPAGVSEALLRETIVVADGNEVTTRARAVASLLQVLPFGLPLALLLQAPGIAWLGDRAYRLVSRHRARISARLGLAACELPSAQRQR